MPRIALNDDALIALLIIDKPQTLARLGAD
jgi:hypothetical protein